MRYISTRGQAPVLGFAGVLLAGLAEDGGPRSPNPGRILPPPTGAPCAACPTQNSPRVIFSLECLSRANRGSSHRSHHFFVGA